MLVWYEGQQRPAPNSQSLQGGAVIASAAGNFALRQEWEPPVAELLPCIVVVKHTVVEVWSTKSSGNETANI